MKLLSKFLFLALSFGSFAVGQSLEQELSRVPLRSLALEARERGDASRGAVVFFQPFMACSKCHIHGSTSLPQSALGPDLTALSHDVSDESIVESLLMPSKVIRKGFESATVVTQDGKSITGLIVKRNDKQLEIRDVTQPTVTQVFKLDEVDDWKVNDLSIMPSGQVNQLNSRQQFLDLVRYLIDVREGGMTRARQLQPPATLLTFTVPEYEKRIDHAGLIRDWNSDSLKRGEAIYQRVCMNCHGTQDKPGSLPTSLRFAEGKFKNGSDPLSMYRTLTHGFGLMVPQTWMVPSQKYDVIHYIRETYLKDRNPTQYVSIDNRYLSNLPEGDTRGPGPSTIEAWSAMDYGPSLTHTYEVPGLKENFAYKGIAIRLDPGAGGVSRGRHWMIFDTDTLRAAAAWRGDGKPESNFIDWHGIQFDGAHGVHPRIVGKTVFTNPTGPGWCDSSTGSFVDDRRVKGRDGKRYGPLPREWGRFKGLYHHNEDVVLAYSIGNSDVLEWPRLVVGDEPNAAPWYGRTFNIGPRDSDLVLQVAEHPSDAAQLTYVSKADSSTILFSPTTENLADAAPRKFEFDGNSFLEVNRGEVFDLCTKDFTIVAKVKTREDGSICSVTQSGPKWIPNGQSLFIRGGRLTFDIGWVGAVAGKTKINDGEWHTVAATWQHANKRLRLFVDGKRDGEGKLEAKAEVSQRVLRIGFTSPNFPTPATYLQGDVDELRFYSKRFEDLPADIVQLEPTDSSLLGRWLCSNINGSKVEDVSRHGNAAQVQRGVGPDQFRSHALMARFSPRPPALKWESQSGRLYLRVPAGKDPLRFTVFVNAKSETSERASGDEVAFPARSITDADRDLNELIHGGPRRWAQSLETQAIIGPSGGPFATDVFTAPESNPWLAQVRCTGIDFLADGRLAVCTWDGDVWLVRVAETKLHWQRIASGMFQPLGLKVVNQKIHVICRDQLAVLHDLNGDEEIDYYECFNNDHQVTEHFHEFAMGLQIDAQGNFYYAKSGCHGKAAIVPHHGTLLKVSRDGSRTEILANGFRAANGVCLNPDGSFVVTDQEGFWNPKNRINWVTLNPDGKPNFYGNMLGYHDVKDESDAAMVPPLCWITNAFDRSPAELLWVDSEKWGKLNGSLLNLSYGYGKVFLVPHEKVDGLMQGGMIELPLPVFPTGVMRGRFHPADGQLYLCGMFAWAGNATHPGGLYRIRATDHPVHLPVQLNATNQGIRLTFTEALAPASIDANQIKIKTWSLKRTANYGSKHFDEKTLPVRKATLSDDRKTILLDVEGLSPTWCMEIVYLFQSESGEQVQGTIHNTIHNLGAP